MARPLRIDFPGARHHVMSRGPRRHVLSSPLHPALSGELPLLGFIYPSMAVEERWIYLTGPLSSLAVYDHGVEGLEKRGTHDVADWVRGRELSGDIAVRVDSCRNQFEVWGR